VPERYLGQRLGRFRVDAIIGSGGFAWVYKGYDPELDIPVAIKVLKPQYAGEEEFETRFRREASTAAKLRHPNIIRILAVGREGPAVYFVMDYLATGLDQRLDIMGMMPEALLIRLGMDVAAALAFAHREGVIHRDVKTDNILFDGHGNAIVADFGIARAVSGYVEQTGTNMVVGTPQYFSPEQARGQPLDGRADLYSLGVTLFKAATGTLPFQGEDWYEIARQHVEELPPKPRAFNPALSRETEHVILKCMEKNPADRYPTGDALHTALVQLLGRANTPFGEATLVLPTPAGGSQSLEITKPTGGLGGWRQRVVVGAAVLLALGGVMALRRSGARTAGGIGASAPAPAASSGAGGDQSSPRPLPPHPHAPALHVTAPAAAVVFVDGAKVGTGTVRVDSIAPGSHKVAATMATIDGCQAARQTATVDVAPGGDGEVTLSPRACGRAALDVAPSGAHITLDPGGNEQIHAVATTRPSRLTVPAGAYTLRVAAAYCADYTGPISIIAGRTEERRVRLICR